MCKIVAYLNMDASPDISTSTSASQTETTSGASDDSYRIRRARNNNSVRKSREKTRQVFQEKLDRRKHFPKKMHHRKIIAKSNGVVKRIQNV
ncbi:CCAAT/enhancer-binding protein alpha [Trichinella pseudospiralis]